MGKYWDWYEVEFERVAKRRLSPERQASILESLKEHVQEATEELSNATRTPTQAERTAVKNIGAPLDVVLAELDQPRRQWLPVWIALTGLTWCAFWLVAGSITWTMQAIYPALWLTPIGVFIGSLMSRRIKLWALFGVSTGVTALTLIVLCFTWLHLGSAGSMGVSPMWSVKSESENTKGLIADAKLKLTSLDQINKAYVTDNRAEVKKLTYSRDLGWQVPTSFSIPAFRSVPTYELAKTQWERHYRSARNTLLEERSRSERMLLALSSPKARNPVATYLDNVMPMTGVLFGVFGVIGAAHLLALMVVSLPAIVARRRWRATV